MKFKSYFHYQAKYQTSLTIEGINQFLQTKDAEEVEGFFSDDKVYEVETDENLFSIQKKRRGKRDQYYAKIEGELEEKEDKIFISINIKASILGLLMSLIFIALPFVLFNNNGMKINFLHDFDIPNLLFLFYPLCGIISLFSFVIWPVDKARKWIEKELKLTKVAEPIARYYQRPIK